MATYISYTSNTNATYSGMSSYISMVGAPLPPTGTTNIYLFGVDNTSSLQFGSAFTGNFKGWIAGTSNTGVNPDLLALVVGTWQDTTDLDNPVWNKISGDVTGLAYIVESGFVGYVPSYAKDDVWVSVDMGEVQFQQDLDTILFIGASITNQSNSDYVQDFTNEYVINKYGKPITLINEAVSGTDVADWRLLIDGVLDTYMATPNLGVYLHIGGGDIDPYANFLDYGEATRQQKIDDLTYIHQAAKDRGLVMVQAALTFRNYDGTTIRDTIAEQASSSKGSYSYTRDWIAPIMKEFTPQFLDSTDWPLIDMHGLTRNIYEEWREPASTDYVHPNKYGRAAYLTYAVDCMISIFGGINPTKIVQRDYTQAISLPTSPLDVVFGFGRSYYIGITDDNINWTSRDRPPAAGTEGVYISDCIDSSGAIVSGINMYSYIDATMRNGYGNTEDPTNSTASLYNNTLLLSGLSTSTGSGAMYVMIEGLESNKEYNIDAVAVASSGGTSDYTCDFEIPNGLNSVFTTDAANPIPEDNIITTVIKTDQMGRAILASVEQSTLNNSIISGIRIYA